MLLDSDDEILRRSSKLIDFKLCIQSQINQQRWRLQGTNVINQGAKFEVFFIIMTNRLEQRTTYRDLCPKICYFTTEIKPDACIRFNYNQPYFTSTYRIRCNGFKGYKDLKCGELVMDEIINEVYERFLNATKEIDIDLLFVPDHLPSEQRYAVR